jgi:hypothetical protein
VDFFSNRKLHLRNGINSSNKKGGKNDIPTVNCWICFIN